MGEAYRQRIRHRLRLGGAESTSESKWEVYHRPSDRPGLDDFMVYSLYRSEDEWDSYRREDLVAFRARVPDDLADLVRDPAQEPEARSNEAEEWRVPTGDEFKYLIEAMETEDFIDLDSLPSVTAERRGLGALRDEVLEGKVALEDLRAQANGWKRLIGSGNVYKTPAHYSGRYYEMQPKWKVYHRSSPIEGLEDFMVIAGKRDRDAWDGVSFDRMSVFRAPLPDDLETLVSSPSFLTSAPPAAELCLDTARYILKDLPCVADKAALAEADAVLASIPDRRDIINDAGFRQLTVKVGPRDLALSVLEGRIGLDTLYAANLAYEKATHKERVEMLVDAAMEKYRLKKDMVAPGILSEDELIEFADSRLDVIALSEFPEDVAIDVCSEIDRRVGYEKAKAFLDKVKTMSDEELDEFIYGKEAESEPHAPLPLSQQRANAMAACMRDDGPGGPGHGPGGPGDGPYPAETAMGPEPEPEPGHFSLMEQARRAQEAVAADDRRRGFIEKVKGFFTER